eukprot:gene15621-biopygen6694
MAPYGASRPEYGARAYGAIWRQDMAPLVPRAYFAAFLQHSGRDPAKTALAPRPPLARGADPFPMAQPHPAWPGPAQPQLHAIAHTKTNGHGTADPRRAVAEFRKKHLKGMNATLDRGTLGTQCLPPHSPTYLN